MPIGNAATVEEPQKKNKKNMLAKRIVSAVIIIIICMILLYSGGWIYTGGIAFILAIAAWEFAGIFEKGGFTPAKILLTIGTFLIALTGKADLPQLNVSAFSLIMFTLITYHVITYPKHQDTAAIDLAIGLADLLFVAYMGIFIIRLRFLPEGLFWVIQCIVPAGISDIGAFFIGSAIGQHKIAPELSPNKTIEGFIGGVLTSAIFGFGLGYLLSFYSTHFTALRGLLIGLIIGFLCPLGDFAKSIFKRHFGLKNTGKLIPGHGGVLDRIDTWLVAGIASYFLVITFYL